MEAGGKIVPWLKDLKKDPQLLFLLHSLTVGGEGEVGSRDAATPAVLVTAPALPFPKS